VDGTHSITASAVGAAGDISTASAALSVTIDTSVPAAPSAPDLVAASDSGVSNTDNITNDTTPTFTGSAEAGATVTLFNGAAKVGTAVATTTGDWTITTSALGNGVHSITTKATDVAGNVSVASVALSVTIDAKAPATPARPDLITASDSGVSNTDNITKVTTPTFTGTAEAASTVTLTDGTTVIGTDVATAAGTWSITAPTLADGVHSISAKAADASGNISAASNALSVTVDTLPPGTAAFTGGTATSLNGKGEAGDTVTVFSGTTSLGTATVGTAGNWNLAFIAGASVRTLTAVQSDKAGNLSPTSGLALVGTSTANTLTSTSGNEFMVGAAGADTFMFGAAFGNDVIADFAAAGTAHDIINFQASSVLNTFANVLSHTTQVGTGSVISLDVNNTLTLNNVSKTNLTSADFTFV
jgi:Bacterial Ig-like domain/Bacterial Ig domain